VADPPAARPDQVVLDAQELAAEQATQIVAVLPAADVVREKASTEGQARAAGRRDPDTRVNADPARGAARRTAAGPALVLVRGVRPVPVKGGTGTQQMGQLPRASAAAAMRDVRRRPGRTARVARAGDPLRIGPAGVAPASAGATRTETRPARVRIAR
jgi:hypothetical protein